MLHQVSDVQSAIPLPTDFSAMECLPRFDAIRGYLDPLQRDFAQPTNRAVQRQRVRSFITARRNAQRSFGGGIFSDPAWDMLIQLFDCQLAHRRVSLSALSKLAGVAPATGQRWIKALEDEGHVHKTPDCLDSRRIWISLTAEASAKMEAFFCSFD